MGSGAEVILLVGARRYTDRLAYELTLDGYQTLRAPIQEQLAGRSPAREVALVIICAATQPAAALDLLRALRAEETDGQIDPGVRVLWVASGRKVAEVLRAFAAGADDVIRSPFVHGELLARLDALMRRGILSTAGVIQRGPLRIDINAHTATFASTPIHLRRLEYALLVHLARDPGRVHTKQELLRELWGYQSPASTRTVDTHACRLRRTLAAAGARGWLPAIRGIGYRLAPEGQDTPLPPHRPAAE